MDIGSQAELETSQRAATMGPEPRGATLNSIVEHLRSPQPGDPSKASATDRFGLGIVLGPGRPRWLGYGFFLAGFIVGAVLALGIVDIADDFGAIIGIVTMIGAAFGAAEVWRGKPLWKR